jgi:hypothetical protein
MSPSILKKTDMGWMLSSPPCWQVEHERLRKGSTWIWRIFQDCGLLKCAVMDDRGKSHLSGIWQLTHS